MEFGGVLFRNARELHDAIAEQWISAAGSNPREAIMKLFEDHTDDQLSSNAYQFWALADNEYVEHPMLVEAFARLRTEIDERFTDETPS